MSVATSKIGPRKPRQTAQASAAKTVDTSKRKARPTAQAPKAKATSAKEPATVALTVVSETVAPAKEPQAEEKATTAEAVQQAVKNLIRGARSPEDILDGAPLDKKDMRSAWHGIKAFVTLFSVSEKKGLEIPENPKNLEFQGLFAMPRDNDVGGKGAAMRVMGYMSLHHVLNEAGTHYLGSPTYLTTEEAEKVILKDSDDHVRLWG